MVSGWPLFLALRAAELARKGAVGLATSAVVAGMGQLGRDPVRAALEQILGVERDLGVPATWFVLAGQPSLATWLEGDATYDVGSHRARALLGRIAGETHEIGIHGSFQTGKEDGRFGVERRRLGEVSAAPIDGVRQHFLKIRPGPTQRAMEAAGFTYDASLGFPDRTGFRLGLADAVPSWDAAAGREGKLDEVPLIWMDRAASKYAGVKDPVRWVDEALNSAEECRSVEGLWTGLWHPNLTTALGFPGAEREFGRLVEGLKQGRPWMARLGEVVRWCRIRRGLVARVVDAGGQPAVQGGSFGGRGLVLEDFRGSPRFELPA